MRPLISIIGDRSVGAGDPRAAILSDLAEALVGAGYRVLTGGSGDLAGLVARGARRASSYREGDLVAVVPGFDPGAASADADVVIASGLDHGRNMLVANGDAVVAVGGGAGTLSEIAYAWMLHRLIVAFRVEGWSGRVADTRIDGRVRYPAIPDDRVYGADTVAEAVSLLQTQLPRYDRRHTRIPEG